MRPYDPFNLEWIVLWSVHHDGGHGVQLVRRFGRHRHLLLLGSPDRVSALSGRTTRIRIRPVIHDHQLEELVNRRGFPLPFGCRRSLLGHPVPAGELGPPCGRLTGQTRGHARTSTGLPRSARVSCSRGGCPLYPGDGGALPGQVDSLTVACRSTAASPCTPLRHPIARGSA